MPDFPQPALVQIKTQSGVDAIKNEYKGYTIPSYVDKYSLLYFNGLQSL